MIGSSCKSLSEPAETPHVTADWSGDRVTTNPLKGFGCGGSGRFGSVLGGLTSCDSEDKGDPPEPRGTRRVCTQPIFLEKCGSIPFTSTYYLLKKVCIIPNEVISITSN